MLERHFNACLVTPDDIESSDAALSVISTFNPGVAQINGEVVLMVRVAEAPTEKQPGFLSLPRYVNGDELIIDMVPEQDFDCTDPRVVYHKHDGHARLTFISYLKIIRSSDGRSIDSFDGISFMPENSNEEFGIEDPRITRIGDTWYITYVAVSRHGATTALASTRDFKEFTRYGTIFCTENKDVVLFPEKIAGQYVALHRPSGFTPFTRPEMWIASSPDLIHWGQHALFLSGSSSWDTSRIGAGVPPIKTDQGWLHIYHGNDKHPDDAGIGIYSAGALLTALDKPTQILRRSHGPILIPEAEYERTGFVDNVIFPTGYALNDDILQLFYGAADTSTAVMEVSITELLNTLQ